MTVCKGCGAMLPPPLPRGAQRKWCSDHCRKQTMYGGSCVECGGPTDGSKGLRESPRCLPCHRQFVGERGRQRIIDRLREWADEHDGVPPSATDWFRGDRSRWPSARGAQKAFGSWNRAMAAAGFTPRRTTLGPGGVSEDDKQLTVRLYSSGLSVAKVAEHLGVTAGAVWQRLDRMGEPRRTAERKSECRAHVKAMWDDGLSAQELAAQLNMTHGAVESMIYRMRRDGWDLSYRKSGCGREKDSA